jgi:hypothetical protein
MRVSMATVRKRADRANEDFTGALPSAAVLVDGAGIPGGEATCRHGVAWYARTLGGALLALLPGDGGLPELLAEAITQVTDRHRDTCDVTSPISPSAAVAVVRVSGGLFEYLVLGDATVVLDRADGAPLVACDPREVVISGSYEPALKAASGTADYERVLGDLRAHRNRAGGFWVAKDDPRAADEAITGSLPLTEVSGAVLLSNGASRIVDRFGLTDWPGVLAMLASDGPAPDGPAPDGPAISDGPALGGPASGGAAEVIRRVRQAEARHGVAPDDATIAHCTGLRDP